MLDEARGMSFNEIRPILSGLIGGLLAIALAGAFVGRLPESFHGKTPDVLMRENRVGIKIADACSIAGILGGLALYRLFDFAQNDWRPLALGLGMAFSAPGIFLPMYAVSKGRDIREVIVAFALAKRIRLGVLLPLTFFGGCILAMGVWGLLH